VPRARFLGGRLRPPTSPYPHLGADGQKVEIAESLLRVIKMIHFVSVIPKTHENGAKWPRTTFSGEMCRARVGTPAGSSATKVVLEQRVRAHTTNQPMHWTHAEVRALGIGQLSTYYRVERDGKRVSGKRAESTTVSVGAVRRERKNATTRQ
jgi:hypothetical protein